MYVENPTTQTIAAAIAALDVPEGDGVMVLLADADHESLDEVIAGLGTTPTIGGVFPAIIDDGRHRESGAVVRPVELGGHDVMMVSLADAEPVMPESCPTAMVFVDGLSEHVGGHLHRLFSANGTQVSFVGGGAGSLTFERRPAVFTHEGSAIDAAVIAPLPAPHSLGVGHGWDRCAGPLVATATDGNTILELNWRPAAEVYAEVVEERSGVELTIDGFFDVAKGYPFGMVREGVEDIVRDPIEMTEDGALVCVGPVPANSVLHILHGTEDSLIAAAETAAKESASTIEDGPVDGFVVDCISRTLFLDDQFATEVARVRDALGSDVRRFDGVLSLGEISSYGTGFIEFFNKTTVVSTTRV